MPPNRPHPPHPAKIAQPKRAAHAATVLPAKPPHPATLVQRSTPHRAAAPGRGNVPTTVQRSQAMTGGSAAGPPPRGALLVEDTETCGDGQVRRSQFLAALRSKVTSVAGQVLVSAGRTVQSCPYIPYWFTYYEGKDAQHIEQAIYRYAPEAGTARTWSALIDVVADRVKLGIAANVESGSLAGVPLGVPRDLEETVTVQRKAARGTIQMCGGDGEKVQQKAVNDRINKDLKEQAKRLGQWKKVVPKNQTREIVFRKLSDVRAFDTVGDERLRPINYLNFEQNEAVEGISLSRNPDFVADLIRTGNEKVVYACALPAGQAYDLEAAYLNYCQESYGGLPLEYQKKGSASKLSQEVTAESVPASCIIGWTTRIDDVVTYHHHDDLDPSINYKALTTYERFERWVEIIRQNGGNLDALPT